MDVLIGIVIAAIIIAGAYVGYHVAQESQEIKEHRVIPTAETLSVGTIADVTFYTKITPNTTG